MIPCEAFDRAVGEVLTITHARLAPRRLRN
jgi:hypothetical protein